MTQTADLPFPVRGSNLDLEQGVVFTPKFDEHGLIPAIVTDAKTGEVLMFAWMNSEALALSLSSRQAHFWSRSRAKLWKKGEDSGNFLAIQDIRTDCDQDAVLVRVHVQGKGVACHTGERSCFYRSLTLGEARQPGSPLATP